MPELPLPFWICLLMVVISGYLGWANRKQGWGLPFCAVIGTVGVWYLGDALYNDYGLYSDVFEPEILESAWWQVLLFLVAFAGLAPCMHRIVNRHLLRFPSHAVLFLESRKIETPDVQRKMDSVARLLFVAWGVLMVVALVRVNGDVIGLFAPYLGDKAYPWIRGRLGGGIDAFLSLAGYLQIFLASAFGVLAAVATNPRTRALALAVAFLSLPYFIFDRARNTMLATVLPGMLAWIFFRLRVGLPLKIVLLVAMFFAVNFWFAFVIQNRSQHSISAAFAQGRAAAVDEEKRHEGLNMFEELSWINYFIEQEIYEPNWGQRYFAEIVNPVPRAIWPGKPMIGIDYAVARGMQSDQVAEAEASVAATISTGMIGQGVVNFGTFFGPVAAALLMAFWVAVLARQDLMGREAGHMLLYGIGMILTFNLGRDITLLVLYPFLFGLGLLWVGNRFSRNTRPKPTSGRPRKRNIAPAA